MTQDTLQQAYAQGFMAKCAEYGVDPQALAKQAALNNKAITRQMVQHLKNNIGGPLWDPKRLDKAREIVRKSEGLFRRSDPEVLENLNRMSRINDAFDMMHRLEPERIPPSQSRYSGGGVPNFGNYLNKDRGERMLEFWHRVRDPEAAFPIRKSSPLTGYGYNPEPVNEEPWSRVLDFAKTLREVSGEKGTPLNF